jgi:SAM-dependent methyltransferase
MKNTNIIQGDIRKLPFKNHSFDIILDLSTIDHIPENQAYDVIKEYGHILKRGGILTLIFWYDSFAIKHIMRKRETESQYIYSLKLIKNEIDKEFDILEEYSIGLLLCIPYIRVILNRMPQRICRSILNIVIGLEYSNDSKYLLKYFSGLYVIIGRVKNE